MTEPRTFRARAGGERRKARGGGRPSDPGRGFAAYEALKASFVASHPDSSPLEYQRACLRFARRAGI